MGKLALFKFAYFMSIVLTFALAVVSILGVFSGNVNPKYNPFMAGLSTALPLLLIINLFTLIYWACRRRVWVFFPLISLIANYNFITAIIQWPFSGDKTTETHLVKIMTLNARNFVDDNQDDSVDEIKAYIEEHNINIICFQEYKDYVTGRPEKVCKFFETLFPYQAVSGSVATFSKFPIMKRDYITFRESNNCAQWIDIQLRTGEQVRVFNVHMQTTGVNSTLRQAKKMQNQGISVKDEQKVSMVANRMEYESIRRAEQANIIADIVKGTRTPVLLCGDFNDTPASYTYRTLKGKLNDGFKTAGKGYMYTYRGVKGLMRIDYILHSDKFKGVKYYSDNRNWSDHNPVVMSLNLPD